ncbi:hypothetical protein [uncultured Rikenella sp.]|uniref:hypothetical protein n=1 Tax=uncultured Rikenella sp. TaxID=368003 RepID=UPI0026182511|nr:hypothetical protein [uncultured Rikenella sp.]
MTVFVAGIEKPARKRQLFSTGGTNRFANPVCGFVTGFPPPALFAPESPTRVFRKMLSLQNRIGTFFNRKS